MHVQDIMNQSPISCRAETDLATAGLQMWEGDFGILPVVDEETKVVGLITDRDICMAVAAKRKAAAEIPVSDVISGHSYAVPMDADIQQALTMMTKHRIRRLPVVDQDNKLHGMISINDIILDTTERGEQHPTYKAAIETLKAICTHRPSDVHAPERPRLTS